MGNPQSNTNNKTQANAEISPENEIDKTAEINREKFKKRLDKYLETVPLYPPPNSEVIKSASGRPTKSNLQHVRKIELHAKPISGKNESKVSAVDGRTKVLEPTKWPNSVHGVIAFKMKNITTWGTGVLIGPHIVLTAGHNLYDFQAKIFTDVKSLQFLPGMNGKVLPFGVIEVEQYFVSPNYIKEGKEDYGILVLKKPIGEETGYFGLACLDPEEIKAKRINVTGYPSDKVADKSNVYEMWGMEGEASAVDQNQSRINYMIDTEAGQSGSGVWYQEGENYYVCGVHIMGTRFANAATLLTRAMYKQIHEWVQQVGFKELLTKLRVKGSKMLYLSDQEMNAESYSSLIQYNLDDLKFLHLSKVKMGDKEAKILAENTSWTQLSELSLERNNFSAEGLKALAQNTSWINLSELNLYSNNIDGEGAKALAQNTSWINLSKLKLDSNKIEGEGTKALAQNTSWVNLSQLQLYSNNIGAEGAKALAKNTSWAKLSFLDLSANKIDGEGLEVFAENSFWINLAYINLYCNNLGAEGAKALGQNTSWTKLSTLNLSRNNINSEGIKGLAQNSSWINLSTLDLRMNNIDAEGAKALAQNTSWIKLLKLSLGDNKLGANGAKALAQNTCWTSLSVLDLSDNHIGSFGARELAQNTSWINLSELSLCRNHIYSGEGLAQNSSWVNLLKLNLHNNKLDAKAAKGLAENTSWTKLSELDLSCNDLDAEAAKELAQNTSWVNLSKISLALNTIGIEGAKALAQNTSWINLLTIHFASHNISSEGIKTLEQNQYWKKGFKVTFG